MSAPLYQKFGNYFLSKGSLANALKCFQSASSISTDFSFCRQSLGAPKEATPYLTDLGRVYLDLNESLHAVETLKKATEVDPNARDAKLFLAEAYIEIGDFSYAEVTLREYLESFPESGKAYELLSKVISRTFYNERQKYLSLAKKYALPDEVFEITISRASLHIEESNIKLAREALTSLPSSDKEHPEYLLTEAQLEFHSGNISSAVDILRQLETSNSDPLSLGLAIYLRNDFLFSAFFYRSLGDSTHSLSESWQGFTELDEHRRLYELGRCLVKLHQYESAISVLRESLTLVSDTPGVIHELGRALFRSGRLAEAERTFRLAIGKAPRQFCSHFELGRVYRSLGKIKDSLTTFKNSIEIASVARERAYAYCELGRSYVALEQFPKAIEALDRVGKEDITPSFDLVFLLGRSLFAAKGLDKAKQQFLLASKIDPNRPEPHIELCTILTLTGETEDVSKHLKRAQEIISHELEFEGKAFDRLHQLASLSYRTGNSEKAIALLEKVTTLSPDHYRAHFELARILRNNGNYTKAYTHIKKAYHICPEEAQIKDYYHIVQGDIQTYVNNTKPIIHHSSEKRNWQTNRPSENILHVIETSLPHRPSGYAFRSHYLLTSQKQLGLNPVVSTRPGFPTDCNVASYEPFDLIDGIPYHRMPYVGEAGYNKKPIDAYLQGYADCVHELALTTKPDLIQAASNFKNGFVAAAVAESLDLPFTYELRGLWEDTQISKGVITAESERYKFFRECESWCLEKANSVVTISETLKEEIISRGVSAEKIFVVPNAVETEKFPIVSKNMGLAEELGLTGKTVVGYISSIVSYEGIDVLIRAFAQAVKSDSNLRLLIVGDGDDRPRLEGITRELDLGSSVIFTGRVDHSEVIDYYSLIDLFVVPRLPIRVCQIVTPLKPYEAMSTGRAIIVSDVSALKEMVIEGETGRTFKAGDHLSLAAVISELSGDKEQRLRLSQNATRWVRENRNWNSVVKEYKNAYSHATEARYNERKKSKISNS